MINTSENRKSSGSFSFIETLGNLVVNDRFSRGYREFVEKTSNNENTFIWRSLSAIGEDIGNVLYENVRHYIENISDVDTCTVKSLASLSKELGIAEIKIINNLHAVPTDVLKLVDLFSINPSLMLNPDLINLRLVEELALCCTVSSYVSEISSAVKNQIATTPYNPELSGPTITWKIDEDLYYNDYLSAKFYDYLTSVVSCEFLTSALINQVPDREHHYIFDEISRNAISGIVIEKSNSYEYLDEICSEDISVYIELNNLSPYFNPSEILDNIDNGTDTWENYSTVERELLSGVQAKRERALFSLSSDRVLPQTSRYDYYKARKILDLLLFVNNLLGYGASISAISWLPDIKYSELKVDYSEKQGVVDVSLTEPPKINNEVLKSAAVALAEICRSIKIMRERLKTFTQQVYLRGSTLLMEFIINEYLRYTLPYRYAKFAEVIPEISAGWLSDDTYERVNVVEYWDTTEYYNLSTEHSDYAKNYGYVNYPFWLMPERGSSSRFISYPTINNFYMTMLGMNTVLSSNTKYSLDGFLSTIYSMGMLDAYIDSDLSTLVLPVDQVPLSALRTTNEGIVSELREYQAFLAHAYSGLSSGMQPYHNWKNVTHPSWQVHPYLKSFVKKTDLDNVIETTYNITANDIRLAAMRTPKISACIGIAGEILNLWRFKTEDFSGYITRYEKGRQSLLKWNMEPSPVVNYEGLFYPDAIDEYISVITNPNLVPMEVKTKSGRQVIYVDAKTEMSCCMYGQRDFYVISPGFSPETFYGRWYSHLQGGFETSSFIARTADQLSIYQNELSTVYEPYEFKNVDAFNILNIPVEERPVDIYRYALDKYLNSYVLVKRCHPDTPEHIKKMIPGQLWIRFNNHPIGLPAFGLPDDYLSCYRELAQIPQWRKNHNIHKDLPQVGTRYLNKCIQEYLCDELSVSYDKHHHATKWDFVYDFDITKDGETVVMAVDSPGAADRETRNTEEKLRNAWKHAQIIAGTPDRIFDTDPPQYTLRGDYARPLSCELDGWNFAGLVGVDTDMQDSVLAMYTKYDRQSTTISVGQLNIPYSREIRCCGKADVSALIDKNISIPADWDFDWNATASYSLMLYDPRYTNQRSMLYMVVGKVPFFADDQRVPLSVQNWYGKSVSELYEPTLREIVKISTELSTKIYDTWMSEGEGHTYRTSDDYELALHDLRETTAISVDRLNTMMDMPGFTDYACMPLSVSKAVHPEKVFTWNSAERFNAAVLRLIFNDKNVLTYSDQYITNSDASYIPLYPGTDGATRTWPVDHRQISANVANWFNAARIGENVSESYSLYLQKISNAQLSNEISMMLEDTIVNSKLATAAQPLGPEYDGLDDKIRALCATLSIAVNNDGEQVAVGSTTFTGSDALHRVIEEYDESKYYNVWIKPDANKPSTWPDPSAAWFDIDIPISHLSVINGIPTQKASDIPRLSSWNFLIYNIDSPLVPLVAEPVKKTLNRTPNTLSSLKVNYVNIPTAYQQYFLEHLCIKEDLTAIDGNRDLFATGTDRDNTTTNYFMGISSITMSCNVADNPNLPVSAWQITLHLERDSRYIKHKFVVDRRQMLAFLYSTDFSQFEDYHYLQHHDTWPYATVTNPPVVNKAVPINSTDPDSAYSTYLNAGNRHQQGKRYPFPTDLYPPLSTEGYHLSSVSAYSEFPGPILSGTLAFKINEESRSDEPGMFPDFLFYQTMASSFNLVVTETQDGDVFALSNTYIMEIVDPMRMVEAIGTFDVLSYDSRSDQVFTRVYEDYMSSQYSISKYDRDLLPYMKWYNAIEPYQPMDHISVYSDLSIAWISERKKDIRDIQFKNISASTFRPTVYGDMNISGYSYGWLSTEEFDPAHEHLQDVSSVVEAVGHGVALDENIHTFIPAGATFANTMGKRWITATWDELKSGCKLFINYEKDAHGVNGFTLFFNYNNFFYTEYLYMDSKHTFHPCYKPTTFLRLEPGETGQLDIIAQPKIYDAAGDVCGIRDIRMFTFVIKNTSDDKPKFDIVKTYELAKGGLPQLEYPLDAGVPGAVFVETVEMESEIELARSGLFDFVTTEDFEVTIPGDIIDNYGFSSVSCDFLYEGFNPYLVCNFDKCKGGYFTNAGVGRIHFETTHIAPFSLNFTVLAGQYVSENELNFQIPIEIESANATGMHNDVVKLKGIHGGANIMFVGASTDSKGLAKEPKPDVVPRTNRDHGGFVLTETNVTTAKGKPIAIYTSEASKKRKN